MSSTLPNLIVAGVQKAGTTSLHDYLGRHPDVCPSLVKELNFFTKHNGLSPSALDLDHYAQQFAHCSGERYRMEASPGYAPRGGALASVMRTTLGSTKVVIALRDPAQRLWSAYRFARSTGRIQVSETFEQAIERWQRTPAAPDRPVSLHTGCYDDYLADWMQQFGGDLRVVFFEDLVSDPRTTVATLCDWLGIDPGALADVDYGNPNPTQDPRNPWLARRAHLARRVTNRAFQHQPWLRTAFRRAYRAANTTKRGDKPAPETVEMLNAYYRDSRRRTASLLTEAGYTDLPYWLRL